MTSSTVWFVFCLAITGLNGWPTEDRAGSADCRACTQLVSFVDRIASNDTELLTNALVNICNDYSSLPGQQTKQMCQYMTKEVMEMFRKVNKETFCEQISACEGRGAATVTQLTAADDPTCDFCVTVVTNVKDIISGGPTELEVKYFVEDACHYLGSFENECVSLSDEYIDNLFKFIRQSLQPKNFCQSIGACTTSKQKDVNQVEKVADISEIINIFPPQTPLKTIKVAEPIQLPKDIECDICKRVVQMIVQQLKDNRTEEAIIEALEDVCSLFPSKSRQKCDAFVEQYANELIHILIEEGDPALACALLGVCVPNSVYKTINKDIERVDTRANTSVKWTEIESPIEVESSDSDEVSSVVDKKDNKVCYECELLMHFIQNEIYDYNNEEQIEEFLEHQLCDRMQIVVTKETCDSFIQQYGPHIMQMIAQKVFDPSNVCHKELKLCGNSTAQTGAQEFQMSGPSERCQLCVSLVQQFDSMLENQDFDKEVAKMVEKSCHSLPKSRRVECELMIEAFAPYFLQAIGHMTDANQVCRSIDMCYSSGSVQLLGGHKCTFGPTYWCHTIAHAEACKATHFCKNKVWKAIP